MRLRSDAKVKGAWKKRKHEPEILPKGCSFPHGPSSPDGGAGARYCATLSWEGTAEMNVKELRDELAKMDDDTSVVVYWDDGRENQYFKIEEVSVHRGTSDRLPNGKVAFRFNDRDGKDIRLFVSIHPA